MITLHIVQSPEFPMRYLGSVGSALVWAFVLTAAPVPKEKEKIKDEDAILGTWKIEKFDFGGQGGPNPAEIAKVKFIFEKDGVVKVADGPMGEEKKATFKLDSSAKIKTIDITAEGITSPGIYEIDGDTLKFCWAEGPKGVRPEEFKADAKALVAVFTLKRVKDEKKEEKKDK